MTAILGRARLVKRRRGEEEKGRRRKKEKRLGMGERGRG